MKQSISAQRLKLSGIGLMLGLVILFSSCLKNNNNDDYASSPVAKLMAFNLATDKGAIDVTISNSLLTNVPLSFGSYTGGYLNIYPGQRTVSSYDNGSSTAFASATETFVADGYYSVFTVGDSSNYKNVIVKDNADSLSPNGQAYVRYINAIPDSGKPTVTIVKSGTEISNKAEAFGNVSAFTTVSPGDVSFTVSNGGTISATRTITLEANKIYTVLLQGKPGSSNPEKQVQIKFIVNGTAN